MSAVILAVEAAPFDMEVLQYLVVDMGADIHVPAPGNFTAMHAAANSGNIMAAEFLFEMGMSVESNTVDNKTPLMLACSQGFLELAKFLHANGASLYACGGKVDKLNTSLHMAAQFGHFDVVRWLVEDCRLNPLPRNSKNATPVDFARAANQMEIFSWLTEWVNAHPDSNESSEFKEYEQLEETLFRNDFDSAMTLLESMSDRFTKDTVLPHGTTPLHYVAASGYMELAKYLVQMGCDVNMRTNAGRTPLHYAAFKGHTDMCMYLYEAGASVSETDNGGLTCLKIAEQNSYQSLVLWLRSVTIQANSTKLPKLSSPSKAKSSVLGGFFSCVSSAPEEVNHTLGEVSGDNVEQYGNDDYDQRDASTGQDNTICKLAVQLHEACILGDLNLARDLVEKEKAPVNGSPTFPNPLLPVDEQELTPLHGAVSSGSLPLVQFLVNKGAHVNAQNVGGLFNETAGDSEAMTPLHIACDKQHDAIAMYLVSHGADLYKKNMAGDTALHIICLLGLHSLLGQIVDLPRSTLPDLNLDVRSSHLLNLLHCAADAGSIETAEILVENNVGVNSFDDEKKTPMHYACAKGTLDVVKLLVNNGAIVDLADTSGRTPFLFACSSDNLELIKYLSERGAQLDHESSKGNTALHIACKFGRLELVKWLVNNGLKVDHINSSGHSPLYYAQANNFTEVVDWLESH
jgi:ankyrin repeat protein